MTTAAAKAQDATQKALKGASELQLAYLTEQNQRVEALIQKLEQLHDELQADKELIESNIAAEAAKIEQMNTIAETFLKLHHEMAEMLQAMQEAQ